MVEAKPCFMVKASALQDRMDAGFYNPIYFEVLEKMHKLADNSKTLKLSPLCDLLIVASKEELGVTGGATPLGACYLEEGVPFVRVQNIRRNELTLHNVKYIPEFVHEGMLKRSQLKPDDVLLTITGMTYGLSAVVPHNLGAANINQHSVRIRVDKEKILPKYLSYFLNSQFGRVQTDRYVTGATRPALDYEIIRNLQILYPADKKIQEGLINRVDAFIEMFKKCKNEYKSLIEGLPHIVLDKIGIEIPRSEKSNFIIKQLNERLDVKGHSPFLHNLKEKIKTKSYRELGTLAKIAKSGTIEYSDSYRLIDLEDIDEQRGEVRNVQTVIDLGSAKTVLKEGQIIVSRMQPESGKIVIVDKTLDGCIGSGELIPIEITSSDIIPKYLWCILRSPYVLKQWEFETTGATRERIGEPELYQTLIPLPDKKIQEAIVKEIEEIIKKAKDVREVGIANREHAEKTFMDFYLSKNVQ